MTLRESENRQGGGQLTALRRRLFELESRNVELEQRLRQRAHEDDVRDFERRAGLRELELREAYVRHLEQELGRLHLHAVAVAEDRDRVAERMLELERELAECRAAAGSASATPAEQAAARLIGALRRIGPLWALARFGVRVARRLRRGARRLRSRLFSRGGKL